MQPAWLVEKDDGGAPHPLEGTVMPGSDVIMHVLAQEGTELIFGYSGGAILPTYDAVFRYNAETNESMPLIVPANEQGAGFMASGYARASGKVGVVMVTSGPGATNTVTPVRDCMADSIPIVVISGQVPTPAIGSDGFQEAPIANIMGAVAKHIFLVTDPEKLEATVRTAFEIARTGRPGPVVIDIPKDVQNWEGVFQGKGKLLIRGYRERIAEVADNVLTDEQCRPFFDAFEKSERPLIYAGGGVINGNAADDVRAFADQFKIPVVTTLMGIGTYDTTRERSLHMLGMHGTAFANYAVEDCDFLIAIGARFDDRVAAVPDKFAPRAKFIAHLDLDPSEIHKVKTVDWNYVGLLPLAMKNLVEYGVRTRKCNKDFRPWNEHVAKLKRTYAMNYDKQSALIQPYAVIEEINRYTNGRAIISTGVGQHQMWAAQYFDFRSPRLWLTSGSMGTMGFGLPAAIGAQLAKPDLVVIDVDGDASIRMNLGELETVTTYRLPVKIVVLNNLGDGMVKQWQKLFFKGRLSASDKSLHKKDFVKAAQADGYEYAVRLEHCADMRQVIQEFMNFSGPAFLEVMIDPDAGVYPMVGPGMSYDQMITGDYIPTRGLVEDDTQTDVDSSEMF